MSSFRTSSFSKLTALAALAAGGLVLGACDSTVVGGGSGGGEEEVAVVEGQGGSQPGEGGSTSTSVSSAAGGASGTSVALFGYEIPNQGGSSVSVGAGGAGGAGGVGGGNPGEGQGGATAEGSVGTGVGGWGEGGYGSGSGGGEPGWDPNRLFLFISDDVVSCQDPSGVFDDCETPHFQADIGLPPAYQQVGTYSLSDPAINAMFWEWEGSGNECSGGGGSFVDGAIQVLSIDASTLRVRLSGTWPADLDGEHVITRCNAGSEPQITSVISYFTSDAPPWGGDAGTSVGSGGSGPDGDDFVIDFADHAMTCSVGSDLPGPGQTFHDFIVHIPASYVTPGVYPLSDPNIFVTSYEMSSNTGAVGAGGGSDTPGVLTILQVTDSYVELQLEGSGVDYADGSGQVPRCGG